MPQQDYYTMLGVAPETSFEDIKKAYRKLALETHPDRNPNDPRAEERFKKINEAYGVLGDPQKRSQYDQYRRTGFHRPTGTGPSPSGFGYSQEEIFRDFFTSRQAQDVFAEMQREFQRMGFRFDEHFINRLFFGDKSIFFQGIFWNGPGGPVFRNGGGAAQPRPGARTWPFERPAPVPQQEPKSLLEKGISLLTGAVKKAGTYLLKKAVGWDDGYGSGYGGWNGGRKLDVTYQVDISTIEALRGATLDVELPHLEAGKRVSVHIPPGVRSGMKLRLKGLGYPVAHQPSQNGDLYLRLRVM